MPVPAAKSATAQEKGRGAIPGPSPVRRRGSCFEAQTRVTSHSPAARACNGRVARAVALAVERLPFGRRRGSSDRHVLDVHRCRRSDRRRSWRAFVAVACGALRRRSRRAGARRAAADGQHGRSGHAALLRAKLRASRTRANEKGPRRCDATPSIDRPGRRGRARAERITSRCCPSRPRRRWRRRRRSSAALSSAAPAASTAFSAVALMSATASSAVTLVSTAFISVNSAAGFSLQAARPSEAAATSDRAKIFFMGHTFLAGKTWMTWNAVRAIGRVPPETSGAALSRELCCSAMSLIPVVIAERAAGAGAAGARQVRRRPACSACSRLDIGDRGIERGIAARAGRRRGGIGRAGRRDRARHRRPDRGSRRGGAGGRRTSPSHRNRGCCRAGRPRRSRSGRRGC